MSIKLPPKNYDNDLNRRKQGLDQIAKNEADIAALQALPVLPTPAAGDEGKVPKVNAHGEYELATDEALPSVTTDDNTKMLQVGSTGEWGLTHSLTENSLVVTNNNGRIAGYRTIALLVDNGDTVEFHFLGTQLTFSEVITRLQTTKTQLIDIFKNGVDYCGFVTDFGNNAITAFVSDGSKQYYASIATSSITLTEAKELPSYSSADAGKVLMVNSSGQVEFSNNTIYVHLARTSGLNYEIQEYDSVQDFVSEAISLIEKGYQIIILDSSTGFAAHYFRLMSMSSSSLMFVSVLPYANGTRFDVYSFEFKSSNTTKIVTLGDKDVT